MKSKEEIRLKIQMLEEDERLSYPPATTFENAPLALIQLEMETYIHALKWVLNDDEKKTSEEEV